MIFVLFILCGFIHRKWLFQVHQWMDGFWMTAVFSLQFDSIRAKENELLFVYTFVTKRAVICCVHLLTNYSLNCNRFSKKKECILWYRHLYVSSFNQDVDDTGKQHLGNTKCTEHLYQVYLSAMKVFLPKDI